MIQTQDTAADSPCSHSIRTYKKAVHNRAQPEDTCTLQRAPSQRDPVAEPERGTCQYVNANAKMKPVIGPSVRTQQPFSASDFSTLMMNASGNILNIYCRAMRTSVGKHKGCLHCLALTCKALESCSAWILRPFRAGVTSCYFPNETTCNVRCHSLRSFCSVHDFAFHQTEGKQSWSHNCSAVIFGCTAVSMLSPPSGLRFVPACVKTNAKFVSVKKGTCLIVALSLLNSAAEVSSVPMGLNKYPSTSQRHIIQAMRHYISFKKINAWKWTNLKFKSLNFSSNRSDK